MGKKVNKLPIATASYDYVNRVYHRHGVEISEYEALGAGLFRFHEDGGLICGGGGVLKKVKFYNEQLTLEERTGGNHET